MVEFVAEYVSDKAIGEDGYLAAKGLIALPKEEADQDQGLRRGNGNAIGDKLM